MAGNDRQTGRTTAQMKVAPQGAVFVCRNAHSIFDTKHLAAKAGRGDLKVVGPEFIEVVGYRGFDPNAIILDHDIDCNMAGMREFEGWRYSHLKMQP